MTSKKNHIISFLIFFSLISIISPFFQCSQLTNTEYHNFVATNEFKNLIREEKISKCATCHQKEYENELKGPHTSAYQKLLEHKSFVNSNKYQCVYYTNEVNKSFDNCTGCHAPQNLYETFLFDSINKQDEFITKLIQIGHPRPNARTQEVERFTGIDCLSCHFDGKNIISLNHKKLKSDSIPEFQTLQTITKNNLVCYPCHFDVFKTINPEIAIRRTGSVLCTNCHQERNNIGEGTHYYYWQHDEPEKINSKLFLVMDDFHFSVLSSKIKGEIIWDNTTIPHKISPGPEMIMKCEVLDEDSNLLGSKIIRINKKKDFDKEMYEPLGKNLLLGEVGDDAPLNGIPIKYDVDLSDGIRAKIFKISLIHKSQYWFPDSLGVLSAVRFYPINN